MDAVFFRMQEALPNVGGVQKSLGGNAADQQAGPAQPGIFFDDGCLQAVLPARTAAEYPPGPLPMTITSYVIYFLV